jgi:hypothetical protein
MESESFWSAEAALTGKSHSDPFSLNSIVLDCCRPAAAFASKSVRSLFYSDQVRLAYCPEPLPGSPPARTE